MFLHYLVKLEMLIGHVLPLIETLQEETPEFISQLWAQNLPDLNPVDYNVWEKYCKRRCRKYA